MRTIKKLLDLLTPPERKRAYLLLVMILVMALLDVLVFVLLVFSLGFKALATYAQTRFIQMRVRADLKLTTRSIFGRRQQVKYLNQ